MTTAQRHRGFTMIEVAVVMLLIIIVLGMVSLQLGEDDSSKLRDEANRLAILLQTAQEEAILQSQTIALTIESKGYYFSVVNGNKFEPLENDVLRPRTLPQGMKFTFRSIDGVTVTESKEPPYLLVPATGEVAPFVFVIKLGKQRWRLEGEFGGEIKTSAPETEQGDRSA